MTYYTTSIFLAAFMILIGCKKQAQDLKIPQKITFILPERDNLQWLNFYVALGAGFFGDSVLLKSPDNKRSFNDLFDSSEFRVAILPRPLFFEFAASHQPVTAIANLLQHDPVNLVVRAEIADQRKITDSQSINERLERLKGIKVAVAPGPVTRLKMLLQSCDLDPENHFKVVRVSGPQQNQAFEENIVDALYAHTPYLERAMVLQGGKLVINQSAGEIPTLSNRAIHVLTVHSSQLRYHQKELQSIVSAIYKAQLLIRNNPEEAIQAMKRAPVKFGSLEELEVIFSIYKNAIPETPQIHDNHSKEVVLLPGHRPLPDTTGIQWSNYVDNQFARKAVETIPAQ